MTHAARMIREVETLMHKTIYSVSVTSHLPPSLEGSGFQLRAKFFQADLLKEKEPELTCKDTGMDEMIHGFILLIAKQTMLWMVQTSACQTISHPACVELHQPHNKKKKGTGRCPGFSDSLIRPDLSSFQEKPYMHLWLSLYRWMKGITGEHFRLQAVAASWTGYPIAVNTQQWFPLGLLIENQKSKPYLRQPQGQFIRWFFNWEWWHRAEELHQQPIFHAISDLPKIRYVLHHQVQPELPQKSRLELCQGLVLAVMPISFFKTQHNSLRLDMARPPSSKGRQTVPQATRQCPPLVYLWPLHL